MCAHQISWKHHEAPNVLKYPNSQWDPVDNLETASPTADIIGLEGKPLAYLATEVRMVPLTPNLEMLRGPTYDPGMETQGVWGSCEVAWFQKMKSIVPQLRNLSSQNGMSGWRCSTLTNGEEHQEPKIDSGTS